MHLLFPHLFFKYLKLLSYNKRSDGDDLSAFNMKRITLGWTFEKHTHTHTHLPIFTANRGHMIFHCKTEDLYIQTFHNETVDFCVKTWHLTATTRTLTYYHQWGTYPPYASLSCIALSASFKKTRTSSVFCVSSFVGKMSNVCPRS